MACEDELSGGSGVPYYCQWESPELVPAFIDGSLSAAEDPRWSDSGAQSPQEYEYWSFKVCGLACMKMILASRAMPVPPMMRLVEGALRWRAFVAEAGRVAGLIYRPFADWLAYDYNIKADVMPDLPLAVLADAASPATPVMASVHSSIRWPERTPPDRGGHLVLVTGASAGMVRLHNPSGLPAVSQCDTLVPENDFARFFARRGIIIRPQ